GRPDSAAKVSGPTNRAAAPVITTWTSAPAPLSRRVRKQALYAATPPVTPSSTRRPASGLLDPNPLGAVGQDLALGDLLEGDRQRLVLQPTGLDERRNELAATLAELVVVGVDLPRALGCEDHERVLGVDLREQVVDLRLDHGCVGPSVGVRDAWIIASTSAAARSTRSFTTTWSNQPRSRISASAVARRTRRRSSLSVPRDRRRRSSSAIEGGARNTRTAPGTRFRTCRAPWTSISRTTSCPAARSRSTGAAGVPERWPTTWAHSRNAPEATSSSKRSSVTKR